MTEALRAQATLVAEAREAQARAKAEVDDLHKAYMERTKVEQDVLAESRNVVKAAEAALREMGLAYFKETRGKHPGSGVEITEPLELVYPAERALEWAKEKGLALLLDRSVFESIAKADPPDFVTKTYPAKANLATDMRKALDKPLEEPLE